ncbi:hypothetical protein FACS189441_6750 [Betaproteobacteria bacterium]|nr:hypothetical protein FACS189441_6750 [Betaproteobacteria bacterium]
MQAIKQIIDAERLVPILDLPENMRHTKVEVIVFPANDDAPEADTAINLAALDALYGSLHEYANPNLIPLENTAWQTAVEENALRGKYDIQPDVLAPQ